MCDSEDSVCHLSGMLDRDQRTCRGPTAAHAHDALAGEDVHPCRCAPPPPPPPPPPSTPGSGRTKAKSRKQRWSFRVARRFKEVLVVGVYILSIIHIPGRTWGAPSVQRSRGNSRISAAEDTMSKAERMRSTPKWFNPCGHEVQSTNSTEPDEAIVMADAELVSPIINQAQIALSHATDFRENYVQRTFNTDYTKNHESWKATKYDWLPAVPKTLSDSVGDSHLESLNLKDVLLNTYEYLQKVAVGMEQVVWDLGDQNSPFHHDFKEAEDYLRLVLCEIQYAIQERHLPLRSNVTRDIMSDKFRNLCDLSHRNLRDWLIFREYMNLLEYTISAFDHFRK